MGAEGPSYCFDALGSARLKSAALARKLKVCMPMLTVTRTSRPRPEKAPAGLPACCVFLFC